jgi:hypothetical protein
MQNVLVLTQIDSGCFRKVGYDVYAPVLAPQYISTSVTNG